MSLWNTYGNRFFFLRVHTLLVTYDGMKIVVVNRHFDESVQEFSTSI